MVKPYAPDKDNPFPRPKPKPTGNNGGDGSGGMYKLTMPAFLPGQLNALASQLGTFGGSTSAWKDDLKDMTAPMVIPLPKPQGGGNGNGGHGGHGGGNNNGGGKDPTNPDPRPDTANPGHNRFAPMMMSPQRGFLPVGQPMAQAPMSGIFAAQQQPAMQQRQGAPRVQLPPEIMKFMSQRR